MKSKKFSPQERVDLQKRMLCNLGERCLDLADRLGLGGEPLSDRDRSLMRLASYERFEEIMNMIKVGFVVGDDSLMNDSMADLKDLYFEN